ncbi:MAG: hypothetical protein H6606_11365 [Flavobacteriales bacterium]|nr:hypothetical protein [Flavobacteriales bacterium]
MNSVNLALTLLLALALSSCMSRVDLQNGTFSGRHVRLGTDMALLNKKLDVVLVKDGRVFTSKLDGTYKEVHKMKRLHAWVLMRTVKRTGIRKEHVDEPGKQLTYFLQYNTNKHNYQWRWGKNGATPPKQLQKPVDELLGYLKK